MMNVNGVSDVRQMELQMKLLFNIWNDINHLALIKFGKNLCILVSEICKFINFIWSKEELP
jgi:hypothetical protein